MNVFRGAVSLLGYSARYRTLYNWINGKRKSLDERSKFHGYNTTIHSRYPSLEPNEYSCPEAPLLCKNGDFLCWLVTHLLQQT